MSAGARSSANDEPRSVRLPAWLRPVPIVATIMIFTVLMAWLMTPNTYRLNYRAPKYVTAGTVWWIVYLVVAFSIPALIVAAQRFDSKPWRSWELSPAEQRVLRRILIGLFLLTIAGYGIWLISAAGHGFHFSAVSRQFAGTNSTDASDKTKAQFKPISGVTTMCQFGIAVAIIGTLLWPKAKKDVRIMTVIVVLLGVARAWIASERLAMYEVLIPVGMIVAARAFTGPGPASVQRRRRRFVRAVPFVVVPLLVLSFAGYEYSRSWQWWKNHTQDSFMVFETKRLAGYYTTAYNNAQMLRTTHSWPTPGAVPFMTWNGFWNFPILKNYLHYDKVSDGANFYSSYSDALNRYANPEFNLLGGMTNVTFDYGMVGGGIFIAGFGAIVGAAYAAFSQRRRSGLLFYPIVMIALVELPRENYLTGPNRAIPALAGCLIAACALRRIRHREQRLAAEGLRDSAHTIGVVPSEPGVPQPA